jgi:DNA-binding MarR family transcriptional regulator
MHDTDRKPSDEAELDHFRQVNLGRLIEDVHFFFDQRALMYLRQSGYPMIKSADAHVMRTMQINGSRVTDMAKQAGISKQAMSKLVSGFITHGFLAWANDPKDRRNRIVSLTDSGRALLEAGIAALLRAESEIADTIGVEELEKFRTILLDIKTAKNIRPTQPNPQDRKRRA